MSPKSLNFYLLNIILSVELKGLIIATCTGALNGSAMPQKCLVAGILS